MRLSTLALALATFAGSAGAQPIIVLDAHAPPSPTAPASDCAAGPGQGGADIECVLTLTPPDRDAQPAPPSRILIRAQWAAKPCPSRAPQVVNLAPRSARAVALPVVDQPGSGRACRL